MILAFPTIDTANPKGSDRVSTIDNAERQTREWLRQCMVQISGYPDVDTVSVKGWTSQTRPNSNPNGNYLLGYNTTTGQLELIGANGNTIQVLSEDTKKSIALLAHPVGSYYWTSSTKFNPQTAWGGTWVRIQDGTCLVCNNPDWGKSFKVNAQGGSQTVQLQKKHLPVIQRQHYHGVGTYEISGSITANDKETSTGGQIENFTTADALACEGALSMTGRRGTRGIKLSDAYDNAGYKTLVLLANSNNGFSGYSGIARNPETRKALADTVGEGLAHNNMPPYTVGVLWHRTA